MVAMSISFSIVGILALLILSWHTYCTIKTAKHRLQIINWLFSNRNYEELLIYYDSVSYDQHRSALIRFKDPFELYNPELFSTFHMIKYGQSAIRNLDNKEIICPYKPK